MPILLEEDIALSLPKMHRVKQMFSNDKIDDIKEVVKQQIRKENIITKIKPGQKVAVAVGSRGIKNIFQIVKATVDEIKALGAEPFIVSAMGSHGSGTEYGQREVLEGYNITEEKLGVKVITTVDVVKLGTTENGIDVYFDKAAYNADLIVPINRVKLHTDFVGELQSGVCKMLVIGLGNHIGCSSIHEQNPEEFANIIEEVARIIIEKTNVGFGIEIIENGYDKTSIIEVVTAENLIEREKDLVKIAKEYMPTLMIPEIDVLIVDEIGKDISGAGYDPNILGRSSVLKTFILDVPKIQRMVLLDITEGSHGNGIGIGLFDVTTKKVFNKLDLESMYANSIACKCIEDARIPIFVDTEEEAVRVAIKACRNINKDKLKIVKIKNTLELEYIEISDALLDCIDKDYRLSLCSNSNLNT